MKKGIYVTGLILLWLVGFISDANAQKTAKAYASIVITIPERPKTQKYVETSKQQISEDKKTTYQEPITKIQQKKENAKFVQVEEKDR